jgi:type I restriction enzyme S subunit
MSESRLNYADHRFLPVCPASVDDILVAEGDFFVSRGNGSLALVGRGATAQTPPFPVIFPDTMMRLRFNDAEVRRWVATLWPSRLVRRQIEQRVKTTAGIYKIAQPQVASISVPLPPASERERIVAGVDRRLSIVREVEAEVDANLKRAGALRHAVLARAYQTSPAMESCQ